VLALLLCRAGSPVSVDLLTEAVWPDEPPRTARKNLQVYVSALRKLFGTGDATGTGDGVPRVVSQPAGYLLTLPPDRLDALRFRALVRDGRAAAARGEPARAAALLRAGLDLWRGAPLSDLRVSPPLRAEARRLAGDRVAAYEEWAEAELRLGNAHAVAEGIAEVAERHPQRERLQATRMSALHQCGRRAEALGVYDELRQWLARELGLAVSPRLETLYRSILADGPAAPPPAPEPAATGALLPADLADFTGRAEESALLEKVLPGGRGRTVLLVGPSGVGKTALAVHGAHRLGEHFPDGRLLVGLRTEDGRPRPAASVLGEIVRTAGLAARVPADPARAAALCRAWLTGHRVLLVLDDAPDEALARQLLPCGGRGGLLVTARAQLAGLTGVERVAVPPMAEDEALQLLGRIIGEERLARDRAAARRIVGACGALPLAVRVAGMRLAVLRHLPLAEYAGRLAETGATLEELAAGDVAVRPRLDVCWQDLADGERGALLRLTGLPPGAPFTLGQAATALDSGAGRAQHVLERLIETGAVLSPQEEVAAHAARYTVPYLLHLYARERRAA
jgi:DNA-binding SARP family transcriptional activator